MSEVRAVLDEAAFRALCRGEIVTVPGNPSVTLKLILSDIGFDRMGQAVDDAMEGRKP